MKNRKSRIIGEVRELSRSFSQRTIPADYMDRFESREAYGAYYGEVGRAKGEALGEEILLRGSPELFRKERLRILDLGSGTGEFSLALARTLLASCPVSVDLHMVDRSEEALVRIAGDKDGSALSLSYSRALLPAERPFLGEGWDIVSMANCLAENESAHEGFEELFGAVVDVLSPEGLLLLVEPADKRSSRALLSLGDSLLERTPGLVLLAPCPGSRSAPCPALSDPDNWCHEDRPAGFSGELLRTAEAVGHVKDALKMTYLLFSRSSPLQAPALRLVSPLHREKGLFWGDFCDGRAWARIRLLTRNKGELTRDFSRLRRGETIAPPPDWPPVKTGLFDWPKDRPIVRLSHPDGRPFEPGGREPS
ncbi:MAG: methyltransferase domain-containing protein [Leptospirales bacterium]